MRSPFASILVSLAFLSPSLAATIQVYLVAGQSNANTSVAAGVESTMNNWLGAANVEIVRSEHGGSPLWQWSVSGQRGNNYQDDLAALVGRIEAIEAGGDDAVFGGLIWMQGESDVTQPSTIGLYESRFLTMLDFYRQDLGLAEAPSFTVGVIDANPAPAYDSAINRAHVDAMRDVLFDLGTDPNGGAVDSRGLARTDLWHLNGPASVSFGNQLALNILGTNQVPEPSAGALLALVGIVLASRRRR